MRKLFSMAIGAVALASASMASAAVVTGSTGLQNVTEVSTPGLLTIAFEQNQITAGSFSGILNLNNPSGGTYSINIATSTPGVTFTSGTLFNVLTSVTTPLVLGPTICCGANSSIGLPATFFAAGQYNLTFNGSSTVAGTDTGSVTIRTVAVPEPATWALMLLGFGGMGMAMRRRRSPALAQVA